MANNGLLNGSRDPPSAPESPASRARHLYAILDALAEGRPIRSSTITSTDAISTSPGVRRGPVQENTLAVALKPMRIRPATSERVGGVWVRFDDRGGRRPPVASRWRMAAAAKHEDAYFFADLDFNVMKYPPGSHPGIVLFVQRLGPGAVNRFVTAFLRERRWMLVVEPGQSA